MINAQLQFIGKRDIINATKIATLTFDRNLALQS